MDFRLPNSVFIVRSNRQTMSFFLVFFARLPAAAIFVARLLGLNSPQNATLIHFYRMCILGYTKYVCSTAVRCPCVCVPMSVDQMG